MLALACLAIASCQTPPVVTPKPDVTPVVTSNKRIQESSRKLHESTKATIKLNQDIQANLDSGLSALDKILRQ